MYSSDNLVVVLTAELKGPSHESKTRFSFTHKGVWMTSEVQLRRLHRSQAILFICLPRMTF